MLKFWMVLLGFGMGIWIAISQVQQFALFYFILSPIFIFPIFYFGYRQRYYFAGAASLLMVVLLAAGYPSDYPVLSALLIAECLILMGLLCFYWAVSEKKNAIEVVRKDQVLAEWSQLSKKIKSRSDSLKHLENQVNGLLELFETAKDFNEALSYDALADTLYRNIMPERLFSKVYLVPFEDNLLLEQSAYVISSESCDKKTMMFSAEDIECIKASQTASQVMQKKDRYYFPILAENQLIACFIAEGILSDDLARIEVLTAFLALHIRKIRLYEKVRELAIRDSLTGVFVRRHFIERFEGELKRAQKYKLPLAVLMLDIDYFKRYNDEHGHLAGDAALKQVSQVLKDSLRKVDIIARYGGEEFVVIIPETKFDGALEVAERIRSGIARHHFEVFNQTTRVTVSIGAALFPDHVRVAETNVNFSELALELIQDADKALYRAKEEGRNRVVFYQ